MSTKEFAGPGKSFPVNDPTHAKLAISGATRSENAGNISAAEADKIKAKARAKLGMAKDKPSKPAKAAQSAPGGSSDGGLSKAGGAMSSRYTGKGDGFLPDSHVGVEHTSKHR